MSLIFKITAIKKEFPPREENEIYRIQFRHLEDRSERYFVRVFLFEDKCIIKHLLFGKEDSIEIQETYEQPISSLEEILIINTRSIFNYKYRYFNSIKFDLNINFNRLEHVFYNESRFFMK